MKSERGITTSAEDMDIVNARMKIGLVIEISECGAIE
jgi:hypothetical protein